jgi:hypothetical protein
MFHGWEHQKVLQQGHPAGARVSAQWFADASLRSADGQRCITRKTVNGKSVMLFYDSNRQPFLSTEQIPFWRIPLVAAVFFLTIKKPLAIQ